MWRRISYHRPVIIKNFVLVVSLFLKIQICPVRSVSRIMLVSMSLNCQSEVSIVLKHCMRACKRVTESLNCLCGLDQVGFKPAGGIRTAAESVVWLTLMKEELGDEWLSPHLFRLGASSLLADIERQVGGQSGAERLGSWSAGADAQ